MAEAPRRRFTLLDAMLLVVAAAVGLALARLTLHDHRSITSSPVPTTMAATPTSHSLPAMIELRRAISWLVTTSTAVYPSVMTFTIATLILRLGQPRPRLRLVFQQPGAVGCSAAVMALRVSLFTLAPSTIHTLPSPSFYGWMFNVWLIASRGAGMAVAGAWLSLAVSGHWRRVRSWVDLMGRVLGVAWIAAILLECASVWLSFFY